MKKNPKNRQLTANRQGLTGAPFAFECHPGTACFTQCCKDTDMVLYPYDIIRLKNRLDLSSDQFLQQYTISALRDNPYFPSVTLKMSDRADKSCPFLSAGGCMVYEDRPYSCRSYPLERAKARVEDANRPQELYFIVRHSYCLGHGANRNWTVDEWIEVQQIKDDNKINDRWVGIDTLFRQNPWGLQGLDSPKLKMAFMACFNVDTLKTFILQSSFLGRFDVGQEKVDKLMKSDEALLKFGFDWIEFFLTGRGPLHLKK
jgi:Fe-S-cluster containining protein